MTGAMGWLANIAETHAATHTDGCIGTAALIDEAARMRGIQAVTEGRCMSIARPVVASRSVRKDDARMSLTIEQFVSPLGDLTVGTGRIEIDAHGHTHTHMDALRHVGVNGRWHGGAECSSSPGVDSSMSDWARHGLVTRAVLLDIPASRQTDWVEPSVPVTAADLDQAYSRTGVEIQPGDALLLYLGRDRFEAAGHVIPAAGSGTPRSGVGPSGAEWIARRQVSVLGWDFFDAVGPEIPAMCVHRLIWAIGLLLLDNCDLGPAAQALSLREHPTALLSVAPLPIDGVTGCLVNPLLTW